ncbi:hypothetical protein ACFSTD_17615 [Novosphingobium colocasiae]
MPKESYLSIGGGVSGNTETTNKLGYTYYGAGSDWTGFDDGTRDMPKALTDFIASGATTSGSSDAALAAGGALITGNNALVQRWKHLPANFSGSIDGGTAIDVGSDRLGILFFGRIFEQVDQPRCHQPAHRRSRCEPVGQRFPLGQHRQPDRRQRPAGPGLRIR